MLELLSKIISSLILSVTATIIGATVIEKKLNLTFQNIIAIGLLSIGTILSYNSDYNVGTTLVIFFLMTFIYKSIFQIFLHKAVIVSFITLIVTLIANICFFIILSILGLDLNIMREVSHSVIISNLSICIISLLIIKIEFIRKTLSNVINLVSNRETIICFVVCLFYISVTGLLFSKTDIQIKGSLDFYINIMVVFLLVIIIYTYIVERIKYREIIHSHNILSHYIKDIEQWIQKYRVESHENKNQLIVIKNLIDKKNKKATEYLDSLLKPKVDEETLWLEKVKEIPEGGLKGLIYYKIKEMQQEKLKIYLDVEKKIEKNILSKITIDQYKNLCQIVGVYLDNAIEAAKESKKKQLMIEIYKEKKKNLIINISNSFNGEIKLNKITVGYSTKGRNRGYGLSLVNSILQKNTIFSQNRKIIDDYYMQQLKINLLKK
jgi:two-component system, LytTR family, sensor histidine kinase AgrC